MIAYSYKRIIFGLLLMVLSLFVVACTATPEVEIVEFDTPVPEVDGGDANVSTPEAETATPEVDTGDATTPEAETATPEVDTGEGATPVTQGGSTYYIDELLINVMESFPVQVSATVRGNLANGCIGFEGITPTREGNTFVLDVNTSHSGADGCTQMLEPFEENVSLDVEGLPAGEYTVKVDETMSTFMLEMDNTANQNSESGVALTLERTACYGTCPVYEVKVYADGRIEYEGRDYVDVTGSQSSNMEADKVSDLVNQFVEAGYLQWNDTYTNYYVTDMPTMITSVTVNGETKRIERYAGDESAPLELIKLENLIDKAVSSVQWTGKEPMEPEPEPVGLANPASEYCVEEGGVLEIRRDENGGQFGMCTFPDGSECEEWALFRGECAAGDSLEGEGEPSEGESVTLDGTQWLFSWGEVEGTQFAPFADQPITLNFDEDQINGNGSCNSFFGGYTIEGESLTIGEMGATAMACETELMELEREFFEALQSANGFTYNNSDSLTLSLPNGTLHFSANMPVEKTIFIGAEQVDCQGVAPQKCYLVKEDLDAEWQYFYGDIVGFEWQAGVEYELRMRITPVENPPADAPSVMYELIEMVNEVPVQS